MAKKQAEVRRRAYYKTGIVLLIFGIIWLLVDLGWIPKITLPLLIILFGIVNLLRIWQKHR